MREMAIEHKENWLFVSFDDKANLDYGEPGTALSTGVRGKKSLIPINSTLRALDHDVSQKMKCYSYSFFIVWSAW